MRDDQYQYVRLSDANIAHLVQLMNTVYGSDTDLDTLRRKYATAALGGRYIGFLAYARGQSEAAAYYGVFPLRIRFGNEELLGSQSGDTMTHPAHRGKGLFVNLARQTYELAQAEGITCVFGFPNPASYSGFVKNLGWLKAYDMVAINIVTPTVPLALLAKKIAWVGRIQRALLSRLLRASFDLAPADAMQLSSVAVAGAPGVLRDAAFCDYKSANCLVLRNGKATLIVKHDGDISVGELVDTGDGSDARRAVRKLRWIGALLGMPRIKSYASPNSALHALLSQSGFCKTSLAYGYRDFSTGHDLSKLQFTYVDYDTF